jgi:hypothetical protein
MSCVLYHVVQLLDNVLTVSTSRVRITYRTKISHNKANVTPILSTNSSIFLLAVWILQKNVCNHTRHLEVPKNIHMQLTKQWLDTGTCPLPTRYVSHYNDGICTLYTARSAHLTISSAVQCFSLLVTIPKVQYSKRWTSSFQDLVDFLSSFGKLLKLRQLQLPATPVAIQDSLIILKFDAI